MKVHGERGREALYLRMCVCLLIVQAFLLWIVVMRGLTLSRVRASNEANAAI